MKRGNWNDDDDRPFKKHKTSKDSSEKKNKKLEGVFLEFLTQQLEHITYPFYLDLLYFKFRNYFLSTNQQKQKKDKSSKSKESESDIDDFISDYSLFSKFKEIRLELIDRIEHKQKMSQLNYNSSSINPSEDGLIFAKSPDDAKLSASYHEKYIIILAEIGILSNVFNGSVKQNKYSIAYPSVIDLFEKMGNATGRESTIPIIALKKSVFTWHLIINYMKKQILDLLVNPDKYTITLDKIQDFYLSGSTSTTELYSGTDTNKNFLATTNQATYIPPSIYTVESTVPLYFQPFNEKFVQNDSIIYSVNDDMVNYFKQTFVQMFIDDAYESFLTKIKQDNFNNNNDKFLENKYKYYSYFYYIDRLYEIELNLQNEKIEKDILIEFCKKQKYFAYLGSITNHYVPILDGDNFLNDINEGEYLKIVEHERLINRWFYVTFNDSKKNLNDPMSTISIYNNRNYQMSGPILREQFLSIYLDFENTNKSRQDFVPLVNLSIADTKSFPAIVNKYVYMLFVDPQIDGIYYIHINLYPEEFENNKTFTIKYVADMVPNVFKRNRNFVSTQQNDKMDFEKGEFFVKYKNKVLLDPSKDFNQTKLAKNTTAQYFSGDKAVKNNITIQKYKETGFPNTFQMYSQLVGQQQDKDIYDVPVVIPQTPSDANNEVEIVQYSQMDNVNDENDQDQNQDQNANDISRQNNSKFKQIYGLLQLRSKFKMYLSYVYNYKDPNVPKTSSELYNSASDTTPTNPQITPSSQKSKPVPWFDSLNTELENLEYFNFDTEKLDIKKLFRYYNILDSSEGKVHGIILSLTSQFLAGTCKKLLDDMRNKTSTQWKGDKYFAVVATNNSLKKKITDSFKKMYNITQISTNLGVNYTKDPVPFASFKNSVKVIKENGELCTAYINISKFGQLYTASTIDDYKENVISDGDILEHLQSLQDSTEEEYNEYEKDILTLNFVDNSTIDSADSQGILTLKQLKTTNIAPVILLSSWSNYIIGRISMIILENLDPSFLVNIADNLDFDDFKYPGPSDESIKYTRDKILNVKSEYSIDMFINSSEYNNFDIIKKFLVEKSAQNKEKVDAINIIFNILKQKKWEHSANTDLMKEYIKDEIAKQNIEDPELNSIFELLLGEEIDEVDGQINKQINIVSIISLLSLYTPNKNVWEHILDNTNLIDATYHAVYCIIFRGAQLNSSDAPYTQPSIDTQASIESILNVFGTPKLSTPVALDNLQRIKAYISIRRKHQLTMQQRTTDILASTFAFFKVIPEASFQYKDFKKEKSLIRNSPELTNIFAGFFEKVDISGKMNGNCTNCNQKEAKSIEPKSGLVFCSKECHLEYHSNVKH
jgi:hypothetical protein